MKKRLRRKLSKGEFAHPYPHTRKEREANAQVKQAVTDLIERVGIEEFIRRVKTRDESVSPPPLQVPRQPPIHPNDRPYA